jgi:cyclophilin family peptidyl-prolyl cis-trans isomerase
MTRRVGVGAVLLVLAVAGSLVWLARTVRSPQPVDRWLALILEAEERRDPSPTSIQPLLDGLRVDDPDVARRAVRGLGRLEEPSLLSAIGGALASTYPEVRAEAANAVAQAAFRGEVRAASALLESRAAEETHPLVLGALAQALGRLAHASADDVARAESTLLDILARSEQSIGPDPFLPAERLGVALGFEALVRRHGRTQPLGPAAIAGLERLALPPAFAIGERTTDRARVAAVTALVTADALSEATLSAALDDADPQIRRLAARALVRRGHLTGPLAERALADPLPMVRFEVVAGLAEASSAACALAARSLDDVSPHVRLKAIDVAAGVCAGLREAAPLVARLRRLVEAPVPSSGPRAPWHARAHALVGLASLDPLAIGPALETAAQDPTWQLRMYAARAAGRLARVDLLVRLARDAHHNVREAALGPLATHAPADAEPLARDALASRDYQLVLSAARALRSASDREATLASLFDALDRLSAERRETSRDPRKAILDAVDALGGPVHAGRLEPYLTDFDPVIADAAASILTGWTGRPTAARPNPTPRPPLPSVGELRTWARSTAVVTMADGAGSFTLRLLPFDAPTSVARLVRLIESGYFDGLTWHRVEFNFVVQGGSPGANEYAGDGPFTRDELVSGSHLRGTVGISTRGRDTGDGQLFVNLVDNLRLDHNYTIVAEVIDGMGVVDRILEGDVIERIRLDTP